MVQIYIALITLVSFTFAQSVSELDEIILNFIKGIWNDTITTTKYNITDTCFDYFNNAINDPYDLYTIKFVKDSAKNKNDLGSYQDCMNIVYKSRNNSYTSSIVSNLTYIVFSLDNSTVNNNGNIYKDLDFFMFGACLVRGCIVTDYKNLFYSAMVKLNIFPNLRYEDVKVININEMQLEVDWTIGFKMIPFIVILFFFLFAIYPTVPVCVFKCCFRKLKLEKNNECTIQTVKRVYDINYTDLKSTNSLRMNLFKQCFDIFENSNTLVTSESKDNGLNIIYGLRGLTMILTIIGCTFRDLYISPIKIICMTELKEMISSYFFSLIIFGRRFGPQLLYTYSGYILIYKFISYLDNAIDTLELKDKVPFEESKAQLDHHDKNESNHCTTHSIKKPLQLPNKFSLICHPYSDYRSNIRVGLLFHFIGLQIYKYIIYVISIFFFKYSFYTLFTLSNFQGPIWIYFKNTVIDIYSNLQRFSELLLFSSFSKTLYYPYDLFYLATNEIIYFLLSTVLIFYFYKKNFRLDKFILVIIITGIIGKVIFFTFNYPDFLPSMVFQSHDFYFILKNPLYSISNFYIGLYFGLVNYCIQNSINKEKLQQEKKSFLKYPTAFIEFFKFPQLVKTILVSLSSFIILCTTLVSFVFIYRTFFMATDDDMTKFYTNYWVNLYFTFDVELVSLMLFLLLCPILLLGDNFIFAMLKSNFWNVISKPYYTYTLIGNIIILYLFYQSETRVKINFLNVIFYSILAITIIVISSALVYITIEVPMKRVNKFILDNGKDEDHKSVKIHYY
jgi:hypothetical protein